LAQALWESTRKLRASALEALKQFNPMTLRQLFYVLVSRLVLVNCTPDYRRLSRVTTQAREEGVIPWQWMVDRTRPVYQPNVWNDAEGYVRAVSVSYRRNYWNDQPCYSEVWSEKDTIIGSVQPVTDELGVTTRVARGFDSFSGAKDIAVLFEEKLYKKVVHVFYLGDHDASGRDIERDLERRVREYGECAFTIRRLAIHKEDIERFNLPPQKIKPSDPRAARFRKMYGNKCVELDALPPDALRRRVREAIEGLIDWEVWSRAITVEEAERESITRIVTNMTMGRNGGAED